MSEVQVYTLAERLADDAASIGMRKVLHPDWAASLKVVSPVTTGVVKPDGTEVKHILDIRL